MNIQRRVETPEAKLISGLCLQIEKARLALIRGDWQAALDEVEHAQTITEDSFEQHPEMKERWYQGTKRETWLVICPKCGGYVSGHATGAGGIWDVCECEPITEGAQAAVSEQRTRNKDDAI